MPTLSSTVQPLTEAQERQFAIIGFEATRAMESLIKPIRQMNKIMDLYFEPMRQMQRTVEAMAEPIRRMQEAINNAPMIQMMKAVHEIAESQQRIVEAIMVSPIFGLPKRSGFGLFPSEIIDGEIQEETNPKEITSTYQTQVVAVTQSQALVPVFPAKSQYETKSIMGLKEIAGKSFQYKRKTLKKLSFRNCEGRLLSLFLSSRDLFVSDTDIYNNLHIPDGRSFSWVLRNLKRKFQANGLSAIIERRWNPDGYILIDISYLQ